MRAIVATDFQITAYNGRYYFGSSLYSIIKRYYNAFGKLVICARIDEKNFNDTLIDVTDMIEKVISCNSQFKVLFHKFDKKLCKEIQKSDLVIVRLPSFFGYRAADIAKKHHVKVLAESMGCAWDAYWNHGLIGKAIAPYMFFKMRAVVRNADFAIYVTSEFLQHRYPTTCLTLAASNVNLQKLDDSILQKRKQKLSTYNKNDITLMTTAAVNVRYKGQEYVIRAIPFLNKAGIKVKYYLVGGGEQEYLKTLASNLNVLDQIEFTGKIPLDKVFQLLDSIDIYIQPSLQEGLPRSVIEAMSRGCACIGAKTAGIPELISDDLVVKRKSVNDIVKKILWYNNLELKNKESIAEENFSEAHNYANDILNAKREKFFQEIIAQMKSEK